MHDENCPYISKILFINLPSEGINTKYIKKDYPISFPSATKHPFKNVSKMNQEKWARLRKYSQIESFHPHQ